MALEHIKQFILPGVKEIEVVAELERFIRYQGARASAFDIIVASGPNSSQPHHLSGERKLKNNEPVLIDFGVDFQGYKSDLTRVLFLGKINILVRKVYEIVLKAQDLAIKRIRSGAEIAEIDRVAREYIARKAMRSALRITWAMVLAWRYMKLRISLDGKLVRSSRDDFYGRTGSIFAR